jgi:proteasome maturation protein
MEWRWEQGGHSSADALSISDGFAARRAQDSVDLHPVQKLQKNSLRDELQNRLYMLSNTYGRHSALRLQMDLAIFSQMQRLPGLPSSNVAIETLLGMDSDISFADYLNDPEYSEKMVDVHTEMMKRL